jgi:hypothetical protein
MSALVEVLGVGGVNLSAIGVGILKVLLVGGAAIEAYRYLFERRWTIWTSAKFTWIPHACIMAQDTWRGQNWSYDIGGFDRDEFSEVVRNPFSVFPGTLTKSKDRGNMARMVPIGRMQDFHLEIWEVLVMGWTNGADQPLETPYPYIFLQQNCFTWTITAAATARIVSLIPS